MASLRTSPSVQIILYHGFDEGDTNAKGARATAPTGLFDEIARESSPLSADRPLSHEHLLAPNIDETPSDICRRMSTSQRCCCPLARTRTRC